MQTVRARDFRFSGPMLRRSVSHLPPPYFRGFAEPLYLHFYRFRLRYDVGIHNPSSPIQASLRGTAGVRFSLRRQRPLTVRGSRVHFQHVLSRDVGRPMSAHDIDRLLVYFHDRNLFERGESRVLSRERVDFYATPGMNSQARQDDPVWQSISRGTLHALETESGTRHSIRPAGQDELQWPLSAIRSALQLRLFRKHRRVVAFLRTGRRAVTAGKNALSPSFDNTQSCGPTAFLLKKQLQIGGDASP